ncbi:MAG: AraC family transcriptional regulator [bacterium]|nr:AraC family transcriptional regulator [bacterium]
MKNNSVDEKQLQYIAFLNRENRFHHHHYQDEMLQYQYLREGNMQAVEEAYKMFSSSHVGHLSSDPIRDIKYLFCCSITLATRFAIEGGLNEEKAYNASDLYIQKMDLCKSRSEVIELQKEMFTFFTKQIASLNKEVIYSKPVIMCVDYIYNHLNEKITVKQLAAVVSLNPNYLSSLFKKEMGISISDYITEKRIESACNMLKHSSFTYSEISTFLGFSSQSYFISVFKKQMGSSPKKYRNQNYRNNFPSVHD